MTARVVSQELEDGSLTTSLPEYVSGVALAGSHARGENTPHSDLDVFIVLDNCEPPVYGSRIAAVVGVMPKTELRRGPVPIPHFGDTVTLLYADSSIVQINFNTWDTIEANPMRRNSRIMLDRKGHYAEFVRNCSSISLQLNQVFREYADWYVIRAVFACRALMKGELLRSCAYLNDMRQALMQLIRLTLGKFDEVRNPYLPGNRFERDVGAEAAAEVGRLMPAYSESSIREAIAQSLKVFAETMESASDFDYDASPSTGPIEAVSGWLRR